MTYLASCYLSHERVLLHAHDGGSDAPDASVVDASRADAPHEPDAGTPPRCDHLMIAATVALDDGARSGVTPRLVALPSGDVGVVYVSTDGDPTRVLYERLDDRLRRVTGPVTVSTSSFTWAEPVLDATGENLRVAYGGEGRSLMERITFDGERAGERARVELLHPSLLRRAGASILWLAFDSGATNTLELTHVTADGARVHPTDAITTGRYGSGHGAVTRPDGLSHVITYPREGPSGERHGYVRSVDPDGMLGAERRLGDGDDDIVVPVRRGDDLVIVRRDAETLLLEETDFATLEQIAAHAFPHVGGRMTAAQLRGHIVVSHAEDGVLTIDDFGETLDAFERLTIALPPGTGLGSNDAVVEVPNAIVFALHVVDGSRAYPWLVRVECSAD